MFDILKRGCHFNNLPVGMKNHSPPELYLRNMSAQQFIQSAIPLIKEVGAFILEQRNQFQSDKVDVKSQNQLVSYVDIQAEQRLVEGLRKIIPLAGFITEEETIRSEKDNEWVWIVDPLDGTTNFIHGLPVYSVSVGLMQNGNLCGGIVYEVNRDECFYAWEGSPAYCNEQVIKVSDANVLSNTLLATGFPYYDFKQMDDYLQCLKELMRGSRGLRRMGSAAVDLAYVACGRFDGFFEYSLAPWDVAAGAFIVKAAGGKVTDFSGEQNFLFGKEIIAVQPKVAEAFQGIIKKHFKK